MPRGALVQIACQRCRKKRAKCDGQKPCQRCHEAGAGCEYHASVRQSKEDLRAEIQRLRGRGPDSARSTVHEEKSISCFQHLLSWRRCVPNRSSPAAMLEAPSTSFARLSFPLLPLDSYISGSQTDTWTRTGWTRAHIRHLFDACFTWDYLPFCFLCKDLFIQDFESGSSHFCSSALVHATLAISCRLINEENNDEIIPSGWPGSQFFFDETKKALQLQVSTKSLPDIQALGLLSLYQIRCGQEEEALDLAETFASGITELCRQASPKDEEEERYIKARATTYCGAVSLIRMLQLTTGKVFTVTIFPLQEAILDKVHPFHSIWDAGQGGSGLIQDIHSLQINDTQTIAARLFQITEWAYKAIAKPLSTTNIASAEVAEAYIKCLDWHNSIFGILKANGGRTPFALFIHMYYHFCLLCMFRPFVGQTFEVSDYQPHEICMQATQSVLALAQAYDDLFTLRRVPGLMPYLVCTSGLFGLAMEDSDLLMNQVQLRVGNNASQLLKSKSREYKCIDERHENLNNPPYIQMSVVTHARLLLEKMCSSHPAAAVAERMFREAAPDGESPPLS